MKPIDVHDIPTYWFALLEMARERGSFLEAQHALEQLRRLGIVVTFRARDHARRVKGKPSHAD